MLGFACGACFPLMFHLAFDLYMQTEIAWAIGMDAFKHLDAFVCVALDLCMSRRIKWK